MSTTYQPTGLQLQGERGNAPYEGALTRYQLTTNNTVAIAKGDSVALVAGSIVPVTANPVSGTLSANSPIGVVVGFEYLNANGQFTCKSILQANAVTSLFKNIQVLVRDEIQARFVIQANGPVTQANIGATIGMGGFNADDLTYGVSRTFADTSLLNQTSGSTRPLRILGVDNTVGNAPGDAYTLILVSWNAATHYYSFAGAQ